LRLFRSIAAEDLTAQGKVLASMHRAKSTARLCWMTWIIGLASAASQHRRVASSIYHAQGLLEQYAPLLIEICGMRIGFRNRSERKLVAGTSVAR
jgi:hypothetical protein